MVALIIQIVGCVALIFGIYMSFGMKYRATILVADLSNEFTRDRIMRGCSLPILMNYLQERHADPVQDPDGGPYILGYMGSKDIRVLNDKAVVRFRISADQKVEDYSFVPDRTGRRTATQTGL